MKKKKFNRQFINRIKNILPKDEAIQSNKFEEQQQIINKLKVNLSSTLKNTIKRIKLKRIKQQKILYTKIIYNNLSKYNSSPKEKNVMFINDLIKCKSCHFLAKFKEYLITDFIDEFLRKTYSKNESYDRIPKIYNYYKNYLKYFCKPTFIVPFANRIINNYGELNAQYFYKINNQNNNLEKKNSEHNRKIVDKKIIDDKNYKQFSETNLDNDFKHSEKIVFTKSIKNSIDNIDTNDFSLSENKLKDLPENERESIVEIFGNDEDDDNILLNNNSLFLIVNEIKDKLKEENSIAKPKIKEKTLKIDNSINNKKNTFINTTINNKSTNIKTRNNNLNKNIPSFEKSNTCMNNLHLKELKNMIYSPKSNNKKGMFFHKKDNNNKTERYLSPNEGKINTERNRKILNSIIVNINININSNHQTINNNLKTESNKLNSNFVYKSPSHNINKSKKMFTFSPKISPRLNNNIDKPLLSSRNEESKKSNYIRIIKKTEDYNNMTIQTDRNKRNNEMKKIKTLSRLESYTYLKNYNCNKNKIPYCKQNCKDKSLKKEISKINKIPINKNEVYSRNKSKNFNLNTYFSHNQLSKNNENNTINDNETINCNKKFVYHKQINNTILSPLNKNNKSNKRFFS